MSEGVRGAATESTIEHLRRSTGWRADFTRRSAADPRATYWPPPRSLEVLLFIGQGAEVTQPQIHHRFFHGRSEAVVSRAMQKLATREFITVERWNKVGMNRVRLTGRGRDLLLSAGVPEHEIFVLRKPIAPAHVNHTAWINDLRVVVATARRIPNFSLPAWAVQRLLRPLPPTIPDLLVSYGDGERSSLLLAFEIDLGSERLKTVFVPKLRRMQGVLRSWSAGPAVIVVLTVGVRRAASLRAQLDAAGSTVDIIIDTLPVTTGRQAITDLRDRLTFLA